MNILSRDKSTLLCAGYILFVIAVLLWLAKVVAYGMPPNREESHSHRVSGFPHQGSGAELLVDRTWVQSAPMPPNPPLWHTPIAWDYPTNLWNTVTNFRVYSGPLPGEYTTNTLAGKVLTNLFPWVRRSVNYVAVTAMGSSGEESLFSNEITVPRLYSNLVITVTTSNATNLQWSPYLGKGWVLLGATNYTGTNAEPRMWRAMGKKRPSLYITSSLQ